MYCINTHSNTSPIVIHNPGIKTTDRFRDFEKLFFLTPKRSVGEIKNTTIVTWNNLDKKGILERSLDHFGVPYIILGKNVLREDWKNEIKINLVLDAIKDIKTEYLIGLDSFDVIVLNNPNMIIERFKRQGCKMMFSGSVFNYPGIKEIDYRYGDGLFNSLNAGMWVGYKNTVEELFALVEKSKDIVNNLNGSSSYPGTEQKHIKYAVEKLKDKITVDDKCRLFQLLSFPLTKWINQNIQILIEAHETIRF